MRQLLAANVARYFLGRNKQAVPPVGTEGQTGIAGIKNRNKPGTELTA
jgi:hypothetical protein